MNSVYPTYQLYSDILFQYYNHWQTAMGETNVCFYNNTSSCSCFYHIMLWAEDVLPVVVYLLDLYLFFNGYTKAYAIGKKGREKKYHLPSAC